MPIGAFKLNTISQLLSTGGSGSSLNQYINSLGQTSAGYVSNDVTYLGNDSSSRPVFAYAWTDTSGNGYYGKVLTFRVNSDLSVTQGTVYTVNSASTGYISITSERDGTGFRASSGYTNYGYCSWWSNATSTHKMVAFSYDLDAMTLSMGTTYDFGNDGGNQTTMTYIGNNQVVYAQGNGGWNGRQKLWTIVTRTAGTTTLTKTTNAQWIQTFNQGSNFNARGMTAGSFVSIEGSGWNGHGWDVNTVRNNAGTWVENGLEGVAVGDYPYSTGYNQIAQLNNTTRFISACNGNFTSTIGLAIKCMSHNVTWNTGSTAPSWSNSQAVTLTTNANGRYGICGGWEDNQAFMLFQDDLDSNKLKYKFLTVDSPTGTFISQTPFIELTDVTPSANYGIMDALRFVQVGTTAYLVSILRNASTTGLDILTGKFLTSDVRYSIFTNATSVNEGNSLTFTINTSNFGSGTLYYTITGTSGTIDTSDFSDAATSGSITITSNSGSFSKTLTTGSAEGDEKFKVQLRTGSTSGPIVAESQEISIIEPMTMSFITQTTSTSSSITIPATAAIGDFAILFDSSTTVTDTYPSGWTSITGVSVTGIRTNISYKKLVSGDPGLSITGMSGTTRKQLLIFRGSKSITTITPTVTGQQATTAIPTSQSLTGQAGPMIAFASYASTSTSVTTRGWGTGTPTEYTNAGASPSRYVKFLITNSGTPSTTTISMSDNGTNTLQSFRVAFA